MGKVAVEDRALIAVLDVLSVETYSQIKKSFFH